MLRIYKSVEIIRTIYWKREESEQSFETEYFYNLLLEVSKI